MHEPAVIRAEQSTAEWIATAGLFLLITAVIAVAVCLASWGTADAFWAAAFGLIAVFSFVTSLVCFGMQSQEN
jgi:hypothetical protein